MSTLGLLAIAIGVVALILIGLGAVWILGLKRRSRIQATELKRLADLREQSAHRLAETLALYEATAMNLAEGLMIVDRDDRVVLWNPRMETLLDIPRSAAIGLSTHEIETAIASHVVDPARAKRRAEEARIAALNGTVSTFEHTLRGTPERHLAMLAFPIRGPEELLGHGRLVREVTRERELDRIKDELVAVVSHELRTPLASLVGFAELMLSRDYPAAQRREFLTVMIEEGQRLTSLINNLLDLQRMESGLQRISLAPTDLAPLLREAASRVGDDSKRSVQVESPTDLPEALADRERILQVLANLLSNARKYSPAGGEIRLGARATSGEIEITVRDHGLGIPTEDLPRIFQKFFRVDNSDRRAIRGTGLGLAISRKIVEAHGGRMWVESDGLGSGSSFIFTLPRAQAFAARSDVLVVEDDPAFAQLLLAELTAANYSVARVGSAEAGLGQLESVQPRIVLLDLRLPGIPGEAFLQQLIKRNTLRPPVVVISAHDPSPEERQALERLGAIAVLAKGPGVAVEVLELVRRATAAAPASPSPSD